MFQDKLYQELKEAKEQIGNKPFDSKLLAELTYLNCVIKGIYLVVNFRTIMVKTSLTMKCLRPPVTC